MAQPPRVLVFDSGLGGLTVFVEVARAWPDARFTYVADDAGFPYGRLSEAALVARLEDLPEESRMVFVYNKALGYPTYLVSRPFLRQAEAAAGFVEDTSAAIFREPVVIVAERRPSSALLTQ